MTALEHQAFPSCHQKRLSTRAEVSELRHSIIYPLHGITVDKNISLCHEFIRKLLPFLPVQRNGRRSATFLALAWPATDLDYLSTYNPLIHYTIQSAVKIWSHLMHPCSLSTMIPILNSWQILYMEHFSVRWNVFQMIFQ